MELAKGHSELREITVRDSRYTEQAKEVTVYPIGLLPMALQPKVV